MRGDPLLVILSHRVSTLLGLREGENIEERLVCNKSKGEDVSEGHPISSRVTSEPVCEGSNLVAEEKGEKVRLVSQDEILMKEHRENVRKTCTSQDLSVIFAKKLTEDLVKELRGV